MPDEKKDEKKDEEPEIKPQPPPKDEESADGSTKKSEHPMTGGGK